MGTSKIEQKIGKHARFPNLVETDDFSRYTPTKTTQLCIFREPNFILT